VRDKNLRNEVGGLLDVLDEREKKIIFQRFGLDGGKPKTLEEVGKKFGVTRERIRQLAKHRAVEAAPRTEQEERPIDFELPVERNSDTFRSSKNARVEDARAFLLFCAESQPELSISVRQYHISSDSFWKRDAQNRTAPARAHWQSSARKRD